MPELFLGGGSDEEEEEGGTFILEGCEQLGGGCEDFEDSDDEGAGAMQLMGLEDKHFGSGVEIENHLGRAANAGASGQLKPAEIAKLLRSAGVHDRDGEVALRLGASPVLMSVLKKMAASARHGRQTTI